VAGPWKPPLPFTLLCLFLFACLTCCCRSLLFIFSMSATLEIILFSFACFYLYDTWMSLMSSCSGAGFVDASTALLFPPASTTLPCPSPRPSLPRPPLPHYLYLLKGQSQNFCIHTTNNQTISSLLYNYISQPGFPRVFLISELHTFFYFIHSSALQ
jgi:hypothetical protein